MTDLITAEDVERILTRLRSETEAASRTEAADMIEALHAELTQARADAKAAVAIVVEKAAGVVHELHEKLCITGSPTLLLGQVTTQTIALEAAIRAIAPEDAITEVAKLRGAVEALCAVLDRNDKKGPIPDVEMMFCWLAAQGVRVAFRSDGLSYMQKGKTT